MKTRPILFSGPMVKAILDGRKTQTRRATKDSQFRIDGQRVNPFALKKEAWPELFCPYGQPGDLLWVRETFALVPSTAYRHSDGVSQNINPDQRHWAAIYRAGFDRSTGALAWKPSIHMPRWASRLTLEITDVRVERLQDISEKDAIAEGVDGQMCQQFLTTAPSRHELRPAAVHGFSGLWACINGAHSWDANPWVWAIRFKGHQMNVDKLLEAGNVGD